MLMYLIHLNNPEKTQYPIEEVQGELRGELAEILYKKEPQENKIALILQMIKYGQISTILELLAWRHRKRRYRNHKKISIYINKNNRGEKNKCQ